MNEAPTILTSAQLAKLLQVSLRTIQRLRGEGVLRAYRVRNCGLRFLLSEVLEDLAKRERDLPLRKPYYNPNRTGWAFPDSAKRIAASTKDVDTEVALRERVKGEQE